MTAKLDVVAKAREFVGAPFAHQGRSRGGVDCAGLVICVARELGLSEFDVTGYRRLPGAVGNATIEELCSREMRSIPASAARAGDVLLFLIGSRPRHIAIVAEGSNGAATIIHAYQPAAKVVEVPLDERWRAAVCGAFEIPGAFAWPSSHSA